MWFVAGVGLLVFELVTPGGFFAVFFGFAAILVGLLTAVHLTGPEWLQWLLFSVFSVAGVLLLRRPVMQRLGVPPAALPGEEMRGEWAVVTEEIHPGVVGKVELRGSHHDVPPHVLGDVIEQLGGVRSCGCALVRRDKFGPEGGEVGSHFNSFAHRERPSSNCRSRTFSTP